MSDFRKQRPEDQPTLVKAALLERRAPVTEFDQGKYRLKYAGRRLEHEAENEGESTRSLNRASRISGWPIRRWFFDRRTRRLEGLILFGVFTTMVGIGLSVEMLWREVEAASAQETSAPGPIEPVPSRGEAFVKGRKATEEVIRQFFQAKTAEEVAPLIRCPEVLRSVVDGWYQTHDHRRESNIEFDSVKIKHRGGLRYYLHLVKLGGDTVVRPIAVEETPEGYLVDWETAVGYQAMAWDDFRRQRPSTPVYMRVVAESDDYYNYEFGDSTDWACYRLSHPDAGSVIYGYVKRHSEMDRQLRTEMGEDEQGYFILALRFPQGARADHLVYIGEILQKNWVRSHEPGQPHFDERNQPRRGGSRQPTASD